MGQTCPKMGWWNPNVNPAQLSVVYPGLFINCRNAVTCRHKLACLLMWLWVKEPTCIDICWVVWNFDSSSYPQRGRMMNKGIWGTTIGLRMTLSTTTPNHSDVLKWDMSSSGPQWRCALWKLVRLSSRSNKWVSLELGYIDPQILASSMDMKNNPKIGHVDTISTRTFGNLQLAVFSARHRHGMVKDQKLWREIQLQYAKLREDEVGADLFPPDAGGEAGDPCNLERN